ncbi:MAG TPA: hypothetical protein VKZ18_16005 [Polyangia bacterium]|nr:hypothetical protein [Polyangia bacterium]
MGLLMMVLAAAVAGGTAGGTFHRPYARADVDLVYNLLFCDDPQLFRPSGTKPTGPLATVLAKSTPTEELERLADSDGVESRVRILAFNRLRASGQTVVPRQLLGVIVEVPMPEGLDVIAAYVDGRMRYINHTGKLAIVETATPEMTNRGERLIKAAEAAVDQIGPWDKPRLPPPKLGKVRLTFLVSDGLYFGEGPMGAIAKDRIGGPVLAAATQLLLGITDASTRR